MSLDRYMRHMDTVTDGDLAICAAHGVAYQVDRNYLVGYDRAYYEKCAGYENTRIADKVNAGRVAMVSRHYGEGRLVDVGIGSGAFIKARPNTCGHDVNPAGVEWLKRNDLWANGIADFGAVTFWDVLEHVPDPGEYLDRIKLHAFVFCSLPIFDDLSKIRESKHYRPGEHLQYFTRQGFVEWMHAHGFMLLEVNDYETRAGREAIGSFAFKRWACPIP